MPIGVQLVAPAHDDARLLAVAAWCESHLPFAGLV
jgi:Asp-tRNA(Asn)/Glu-tRNA(Gln) amidotransferase A subunit family amidase